MKTVFENDKTIVRVNDSGEVFVSNKPVKDSNVEIRLGINKNHIELTAYGCTYIPTSFSGLSGFIIESK